MTTTAAPPTAFRRVLLAAGVVTVVVVCAWLTGRLFRDGLNAPIDFAAFWTAGRLNAEGHNPYSGAEVRAVQRALGWDGTAVIMWNPPWALSLVMPVGLADFRFAYGLWVLLNLALVALSAELLWRGFGRPSRLRWVAHVVAITFAPTAFLVGSGQLTAFVLFGLAGFLYFARSDRPLAAGVCAALTAVKPHLLALFALWLLLEATCSAFGRKALLGGLLVGLAACVPPTVANPDVWTQYREATSGPSSADHHHVAHWEPPLVGWWVRQLVPGRPFAAQCLPLAVAVAAFAAWWWTNRAGPPRWDERLPWVVGFSLFVAPYGGWTYDFVLLLLPVLAAAAKVSRASGPAPLATGLVLLVTFNAGLLVMMLNQPPSMVYVWVTPWVLVAVAVVSRVAAAHPAAAPVAPAAPALAGACP
jgi:Glycosyltransferase family 87